MTLLIIVDTQSELFEVHAGLILPRQNSENFFSSSSLGDFMKSRQNCNIQGYGPQPPKDLNLCMVLHEGLHPHQVLHARCRYRRLSSEVWQLLLRAHTDLLKSVSLCLCVGVICRQLAAEIIRTQLFRVPAGHRSSCFHLI